VRNLSLAIAALSSVVFPAHATPAEYGEAMLKLATDRGCMSCHSIQPVPQRADGLPPIAPAWRDVALKYRDDPSAHRKLTRVVMTGSNPKTRHWTGKVSDVAMPPNATVVTEREAHALVNWILVLVP
jgi:cytochrome c